MTALPEETVLVLGKVTDTPPVCVSVAFFFPTLQGVMRALDLYNIKSHDITRYATISLTPHMLQYSTNSMGDGKGMFQTVSGIIQRETLS